MTCVLAFAEPHRGPSRLTRQEVELQTPGSKQMQQLEQDTLQHHVQSMQMGKLKMEKRQFAIRNFVNVEATEHHA